ncbi:MAG: hypothetical protein MUP58_01180 [Candidatus Nanohaloarchaeota archaeon QJJ-9]|nr:hypothetical protein [Candidatus Nanohaloarchaeota archaeon QJJ-9]
MTRVTTQEVNQKVKDWSNFQANLNKDKRMMFNQLVSQVQRNRPKLGFGAERPGEKVILSMMLELKRDLEDLRDQLELERIYREKGKGLEEDASA